MTKPKDINADLDAFLAEWQGKLAWAPYAAKVGMDDLDWADVPGTDEHELAQFDKACEDEAQPHTRSIIPGRPETYEQALPKRDAQ